MQVFCSRLIVFFLMLLSLSARGLQTETLVEADGVIWGFESLDQDRLIFTERNGSVKIFDRKNKKQMALKLPVDAYKKGQGGWLDVRKHPQFDKNKWIYLTYSKKLSDGTSTTALARFREEQNQAKDFKELFVAKTQSDENIHYGSRILWGKDNALFISVGDRNVRDRAQSLQYHNGKILRLTEEGLPFPGNPSWGDKAALPEIFSIGHRNPQGLARHPQTGEIFESEFGPRGGDEINVIQPGKNYGWPVVTYGKEYWGPSIGEGTAKVGMDQPLAHWVPSISPSGIEFYSGSVFPQWRNQLFVACLSGMHLRRLRFVDRKVVEQEVLLKDRSWRVRQVRSLDDGYLYISTDHGSIVKLLP